MFSKFALIDMGAILMILANLTTLGLLKMKVFWNKGYDIIILYDVTTKIYHVTNYIVDVNMWLNFVNSSIFMKEVSFNFNLI